MERKAARALKYARDTLARPNVTDDQISSVAEQLSQFQDDPDVAAFIQTLKAHRG